MFQSDKVKLLILWFSYILLKSIINSFSPNVSFLYPLKASENLYFLGDIEIENLVKLDQAFHTNVPL